MGQKHDLAKRSLGEDFLSLHGRVVDELRQRILNRQLKPGERLVEERLANELGVSRNPVREAIRVLASEGLVEVNARRGASVITISEQEARETIEVRALLEGQNARQAARRQNKEVIKRIASVLNKGSLAVAHGRFEHLTDLNLQFHREMAAAGENLVLGDLLKKLRERTAMLFSPTNLANQRRAWDEHAAILRAVIDRDERLAATLAADHVMRAGFDALATLDISTEISFTDYEARNKRKTLPKVPKPLDASARRAKNG